MRVEALSTDFYRRLLPPTTHSPWPASPRTSPASCSRRRPPPGPCRRPGAGASRRARGHLQGPPMAARGRGLGAYGQGGGGGGDAAAAGAGGERVASRYRFKLSPVSRWICTIACRRSATEVGEAGEDAAGWTSASTACLPLARHRPSCSQRRDRDKQLPAYLRLRPMSERGARAHRRPELR